VEALSGLSAQWEHEHCDFCWREFWTLTTPTIIAERWRSVRTRSTLLAIQIDAAGQPAGKWWICRSCYATSPTSSGGS
jgi:hypothetical protein